MNKNLEKTLTVIYSVAFVLFVLALGQLIFNLINLKYLQFIKYFDHNSHSYKNVISTAIVDKAHNLLIEGMIYALVAFSCVICNFILNSFAKNIIVKVIQTVLNTAILLMFILLIVCMVRLVRPLDVPIIAPEEYSFIAEAQALLLTPIITLTLILAVNIYRNVKQFLVKPASSASSENN